MRFPEHILNVPDRRHSVHQLLHRLKALDFEDLKRKMRNDTILVSICAVNSETGVRQPLKMIRQVIRKENSRTYFHSDMTQALGKVPVNLHDVDLASASAHKIFGPKGIGFFYKSSHVPFKPIIYGSGKVNLFNPGTPPLPLIVSFAKNFSFAIFILCNHINVS